jgi:hypothetical protein
MAAVGTVGRSQPPVHLESAVRPGCLGSMAYLT